MFIPNNLSDYGYCQSFDLLFYAQTSQHRSGGGWRRQSWSRIIGSISPRPGTPTAPACRAGHALMQRARRCWRSAPHRSGTRRQRGATRDRGRTRCHQEVSEKWTDAAQGRDRRRPRSERAAAQGRPQVRQTPRPKPERQAATGIAAPACAACYRFVAAVTSPALPLMVTSNATLSPTARRSSTPGLASKVIVIAGQFTSGMA